ncbi:MAG: GAF domain-containing sensor histidine kinase [Oscillatoriales cyanobacterium C42_A2020_001]|nr:GAF domain-containing sensor histidine kinase [Leptolyngbyaceae cyanobacterium C42_A2020_001]
MISQEKRLFCRLDGLSASAREQQRMKKITELGLLHAESIPVFEEATQTAAQTLEVPICILGIMEEERARFKSAVGLSRLGLMNELATSRSLPRLESFCTYVVDSHQPLAIADTLAHPAFANSVLVYQYGIRAYLGVPLIASNGCCIGTLAVMDIQPRQFNDRDLEFLQVMARWTMSEHERSQMVNSKPVPPPEPTPHAQPIPADFSIANQLRVDLLSHLAQELRTPLTSVMGMASVLNREIYGPLTGKQKEYLNIIHNSGQYLLSLMNEIVELSEFKESNQSLNLSSIDIEMLCQQAINTLEQAAQRREQQIRLTVEPGRRIWLVDKDKVRQMLYHLIFSVIQASTAGSIIRLHVSRRESTLNLSIWVSHPWLGEGLPYAEMYTEPSLVGVGSNSKPYEYVDNYDVELEPLGFTDDSSLRGVEFDRDRPVEAPRKNLGLLLSQHLVELHGGHITTQGSTETGFRYVIHLPRLTETVES